MAGRLTGPQFPVAAANRAGQDGSTGRAYRNQMNYLPRAPYVAGSGGGGGMALVVDLGPAVKEIAEYLSKFSKEVKNRALYNALNHEGDKLRTRVRRAVVAQTGFSYGYVSAHFKEVRANPGRLEYRIIANDRAQPLARFATGLVAGQKGVNVKAWNKSRYIKNAFVVSFGGSLQIVKRVAKTHPKGGKLGVKVMYGPKIPREHLREAEKSLREYTTVMQAFIVPRIKHDLVQASIRAGAH